MRPIIDLARERLKGKRVFAVLSGKGGVGKSMVAAFWAMALPKSALIDLDLFNMSTVKLFGVDKLHEVDKEGIKPFEVDGVKFFSLGGIVGDRWVVLPGANEGSVAEALLAFADLTGVENVVVDMPPGTGEVLLTLARATPFTPIVVTTPSRAAVSVVRRLMDYLQEQSIAPEVLVVNMAYLMCKGEKIRPFGWPRELEDLKSRVKHVLELPLDPSLEDHIGNLAKYRGEVFQAVKNFVERV